MKEAFDVFINADGYKKSIATPGVGNYVTFARAVASAQTLVGDKALRQRSYVQAHGSGTPQNRVTESQILDKTAQVFGIDDWLISAVKCYLGHSIGASAGDQIITSLGVWSHGFVPGIATIDHVADDVYSKRLRLEATHNEVGAEGMDVAIINAKGFGGNNASTAMLAPHLTRRMLKKRYGREAMLQYMVRNEAVMQASAEHLEQTLAGTDRTIYHFGKNVLDSSHIHLTPEQIRITGDEQIIGLGSQSLYADMI
jgi:acetoacetyl-[acyl-carrier protein] synthase